MMRVREGAGLTIDCRPEAAAMMSDGTSIRRDAADLANA